ncbi:MULTISPECIES: MOSC domain-containing protein [Rhizobium]|uniref:MOSC domain-containing protein n=1 Tax=Rhizobium rhododendri TaxID=2506430 RepID=A0ABY8IIT3_9HYPH|nr:MULTISPECIES: MOSC domain-containing protein [Rhizobium]MBZ5761739.1 MOSC domain-containing protein [Rhizobium sp. VS19-DR96]MBZ5767753.1 MOSC domain-containing protein [Rhizobium sp. VS19-DR129.2]MBZ5773721.1 MOSC domain-containing protein [Rhizobium sp. VS19-DRK62.2]MBZ5786370.1 MOSC domain-containing protein [Rhizobium sp. VS19-DR121]MBZ5802123.1 MOSC domain-containing protein [Rhizobium sp. VS19-DR181]
MASVISVARDQVHQFSKAVVDRIEIVENLGVEGDAHAGVTVQHRSRVAVDPNQPNLRQVHLIERELLDELAGEGFELQPGDLGENILTEGISLLELPTDTILKIGPDVRLKVTGLRNPCAQIENFRTGLLKKVVYTGKDGNIVRKAGVMTIVLSGGRVQPGDQIAADLPPLPHRPLERV